MRSLVLTVVALEIASGLPYGVVQELAPLWLRESGVGLAELGALTLVGLPWSCKALWAPLVDRTGTWRAWIAAGLAGCMAGVVALAVAAADTPRLGFVVAVLAVLALASATQDVALDGWMAVVTPPEARGRVTGVRVGAYRGAMALAGGGAAWVGARHGWSWAFVAAGVALALAGATVARLPAPPRAPAGDAVAWGRELLAWVRTPESRATFAFILLYKLGDSAMAPMTRPFLLAQGLDAGEVGLLTSTVGAVLVSVGALGGGLLLERKGLRTGALLLGGAQAASNLVYAGCAATGGRLAAIGASMTESLTSGLGTAASLAVVMAASAGGDGRQAATRFAALSMVTAFTRTLAGAISGVAVERVGYAEWFALTFVFAVPALALVPRVASAHERHEARTA